MDATQYGESDYITADIVKASKTKRAKIIGAPKAEETDYGVKLNISVKIDEKPKIWRPNKDSVKNLIAAYGKETDDWVGKDVDFSVISTMGKDSVIGRAAK